MNDERYGVYLIPPEDVARKVDAIRAVLGDQLGLQAARCFMVHATLKGFFKLYGNLPALRNALGECLWQRPCFEMRMTSVGSFGTSVVKIGIKSWADGHDIPNTRLRILHSDIYKAVQGQPIGEDQTRGLSGMGFIAPDCDFTPREYIGARFSAHFTLAFKDIPQDSFQQALKLARRHFAEVQPRTFAEGTRVGLFRFCSENWSGNWWKTLTYDEIQTWNLIGP